MKSIPQSCSFRSRSSHNPAPQNPSPVGFVPYGVGANCFAIPSKPITGGFCPLRGRGELLRNSLKTHHRWVLSPSGSGRIASQFPIVHQGEPCGVKGPTFTSAFSRGNSFCHYVEKGTASRPILNLPERQISHCAAIFHMAKPYFTCAKRKFHCHRLSFAGKI